MDKQVLILIDIQRGFLAPYWGMRNNPYFETNVTRLLERWRARHGAIIHVAHDSTMPSSPLRPGQVGNDFMECALPMSHEPVLRKTVNSAFIGTDLEALLRDRKASQLIFAGLTTDHCVSTTVRMAANLGFSATVIADATATFTRRDFDGRTMEAELVHRVALASLDGEFACIAQTHTFSKLS